MPKSHCWHDGILTVGCGIANTVADLMVTIIPIPLIARLELPKRRRIYAFIFVGTGFLVCAAGAARAFYTWRSLVSSYDQTWESYGMFLSAAIEIDLGVICACVPALRILLVRFASSTTCVDSSISSHLSHTTPLGSRATKHSGDMGSFSDGTLSSPTKGGVTEMIAKVPGVTTGPNSTCVPAVASASMKNAGFIMTRGLSTLTTSKDGTPLHYMWDEPWNGDNAPKAMIESKIDEEDPDKIDFDNASITPISAKTARRISLTPFRANTIQVSTPASTTRPPNSNGIATFVAQQAGIGILPDAASSGKSLGPESLGESDDLGLPIQGTPVDESHAETIRSYGSHTETNRSYETQTENRFSWLRFDLDSPKDWDRPQTGDAASSWQKSSWTDYQSPEDLDDERRKDPEEKDLVGVKARQRAVKPLIMEKRSEELGWDLESNRVELREKW